MWELRLATLLRTDRSSKSSQDVFVDVVGIAFMDFAGNSQRPALTESTVANQLHHQTETTTNPDPRLSALASKSAIIRETTPRALLANEKTKPIFERQWPGLSACLDEKVRLDFNHLDPTFSALLPGKVLYRGESLFENVDFADVLGGKLENRQITRCIVDEHVGVRE
jgi:hypothetical protein